MIHETSGTSKRPEELSALLLAPVIKNVITMVVGVGGGWGSLCYAHTIYDSQCVSSKGKEGRRGLEQLKQGVTRQGRLEGSIFNQLKNTNFC